MPEPHTHKWKEYTPLGVRRCTVPGCQGIHIWDWQVAALAKGNIEERAIARVIEKKREAERQPPEHTPEES